MHHVWNASLFLILDFDHVRFAVSVFLIEGKDLSPLRFLDRLDSKWARVFRSAGLTYNFSDCWAIRAWRCFRLFILSLYCGLLEWLRWSLLCTSLHRDVRLHHIEVDLIFVDVWICVLSVTLMIENCGSMISTSTSTYFDLELSRLLQYLDLRNSKVWV